MPRKDMLFRDPVPGLSPFEFNRQVAEVFDDMVNRSVPCYREVQTQTVHLLLALTSSPCRIYDLGCATGYTLLLLARALQEQKIRGVELVGYDSSAAMCAQAARKIRRYRIEPDLIRLATCDILEAELTGAGGVVMNYTLQFIPPEKRRDLLRRICRELPAGGVLIVSDKTVQSTAGLTDFFVEQYHLYKRRNGYSDLEIARKREALEEVLIPYSLDEGFAMFRESGFRGVDVFFSWYNFTSFVCVK